MKKVSAASTIVAAAATAAVMGLGAPAFASPACAHAPAKTHPSSATHHEASPRLVTGINKLLEDVGGGFAHIEEGLAVLLA